MLDGARQCLELPDNLMKNPLITKGYVRLLLLVACHCQTLNHSSEVIREALRFMDTHEDWIHEVKLARLREQLKVGIDQLDHGKGIVIESRSALDTLFDDIKR